MVSQLIKTVKGGGITLTSCKWLPENLHYEVIMGSQAYGITQQDSDMDIYGWCIPPKHFIFPHTTGHIEGFGPHPQRFDQFQQHHVVHNNQEYDFTIYNIVKYLDLVMQNNPNMIDSIFVPVNCITHMTETGSIIRDARRKLLHKGAFHKFKGYAYSQIHKLKTKEDRSKRSTKRQELVDKFGYDTKFGYHCVRLLNECEQILTTGDIDLQQNNEQLKAIRKGEWTLEQLNERFVQKEKQLDDLYAKSTLPHRPDWEFGRILLFNILESHYGNLNIVQRENSGLLSELRLLLSKYEV